jgi:hypothetical protein
MKENIQKVWELKDIYNHFYLIFWNDFVLSPEHQESINDFYNSQHVKKLVNMLDRKTFIKYFQKLTQSWILYECDKCFEFWQINLLKYLSIYYKSESDKVPWKIDEILNSFWLYDYFFNKSWLTLDNEKQLDFIKWFLDIPAYSNSSAAIFRVNISKDIISSNRDILYNRFNHIRSATISEINFESKENHKAKVYSARHKFEDDFVKLFTRDNRKTVD